MQKGCMGPFLCLEKYLKLLNASIHQLVANVVANVCLSTMWCWLVSVQLVYQSFFTENCYLLLLETELRRDVRLNQTKNELLKEKG